MVTRPATPAKIATAPMRTLPRAKALAAAPVGDAEDAGAELEEAALEVPALEGAGVVVPELAPLVEELDFPQQPFRLVS